MIARCIWHESGMTIMRSTSGVSKGWVCKLLTRYRAEGEAAFEPRSRRPHTSPNAIDADTVDRPQP
ncbi:leucine zipper domain-containing protein [Nonomuraea cavernae]|uniref:leucine zipper domain-containing protein n=1 Tax=Nonomuraea cavernae TaxID=2045107 RepID=UPI0033F6CF7D